MTTRIHLTIARTFAAALVIVAVAAPGAVAASTNGSHGKSTFVLRHREPGSTGYVAKPAATIPPWLANFREPGSTGYLPSTKMVATTSAADGLDWASALVGAGAALGLGLACAGGLMAFRKHRALAHV